ncbi:hypothetical protein AB870_16100 [Pandoraea faecigallinarum]|uniref:Autotransporter domain-containing protein n=2 Tax=Pandoraea faecigallinarum TaxID=656179 RepID=A0A0H3WUK7_9BURK|nr:hypothetical protein AB870_16100 [Pandoraea faecigallinarum]
MPSPADLLKKQNEDIRQATVRNERAGVEARAKEREEAAAERLRQTVYTGKRNAQALRAAVSVLSPTDQVIARAAIDRGEIKNAEQIPETLLRDKRALEVLLKALVLSPMEKHSSPQSLPDADMENRGENGARAIETLIQKLQLAKNKQEQAVTDGHRRSATAMPSPADLLKQQNEDIRQATVRNERAGVEARAKQREEAAVERLRQTVYTGKRNAQALRAAVSVLSPADQVIARAAIDRGEIKNAEQIPETLLRDKRALEVLLKALVLSPMEKHSSPQSLPDADMENRGENGARAIETLIQKLQIAKIKQEQAVADGHRRSATAMPSPADLLKQQNEDIRQATVRNERAGVEARAKQREEAAAERLRQTVYTGKRNAQALRAAVSVLSPADQVIARAAIDRGEIKNAAQIPGFLLKVRAEVKARVELNNALAKLSNAHQVLVREALAAGKIDVYQAIASANKLALAEAFASLPKEIQEKLLTQYASGQFTDAAQLKAQATLVQTQLIDQDRRAALVLPQMGFAAEQNAARLQQGMRDRLAGDNAFMQNSGTQSDITSGRRNVWAQASGDQSNGNGSAGAPGFSMRGAGVNVGADTTFDNSRVGIALGYANATIDASGKHAKSKVDTFGVGLYGSHSINDWFANAGVSYSAHSIKSDRNALVGGTSYGMSAKTHGDTVGGFVEFGKKIETSLVNITPSVTARVNNTSIKGFTESGIGSATVDKNEYLSARVGFGVRLWKDFGDANHHITPSLRIAYEREVADSAPSMNVVLHGINGLPPTRASLSGLKLGRDIISAQAGVTMQLSKRLSANAAVNTSWRQHETQVGASGSIVYHW